MMCPCCSGKKYSECCKVFHDGALPKTAVELMRSRYSAYALEKPEYIIQTTHPESFSFEKNDEAWKQSILEFSKGSNFEKLEILEYGEDWVHFKAYLGHGILEEKSTFLKIQGKWLYLNGKMKI